MYPPNQQGFADAMAQRAARQARLNTEQGAPYEADLAAASGATPEWDSLFGALNRTKQEANDAGLNFGINFGGAGNSNPSLAGLHRAARLIKG